MKVLFIVSFFFSNLSFCFSQNHKEKLTIISGTVMGSDSLPVVGASVYVKGTRWGTVTSQLGNYKLRIFGNFDSLTFTHVSYKRASVKANGNNLVNIILEKSVHHLASFEIRDTTKSNIKPDEFEIDEERIFDRVEVEASFPGGQKALNDYLVKALKYPEDAKKKNIQGEVIIAFTIGKKGEVLNPRVMKGISKECDEAALNVVKNMPNWNEAIQNGRRTEFYIELPIRFSLIKSSDIQ